MPPMDFGPLLKVAGLEVLIDEQKYQAIFMPWLKSFGAIWHMTRFRENNQNPLMST